jgi:hypothetical protein
MTALRVELQMANLRSQETSYTAGTVGTAGTT